jgi:hypothetical protein
VPQVSLNEMLPFLIPLVLVQIALIVIGLYDLLRPERRVRGGSKLVWGIVIVIFSMVGPLVYFLFGREEA